MERFFCGTELIRGEGALSALERWKDGRLLLIKDSRTPVPENLRAGGHRVFSVGADAGMAADVASGVEAVRSFDPQVVAALGDGYLLSAARAMVHFGKPECPLVMMPTLPASGEEVRSRICITHNRSCRILPGRELTPEMVILDPALYAPCGKGNLGAAGFSVLSDALESYISRSCGELTGLLAREAFCITWAALPGAVLGDPGARDRLQFASVLAGLAGNGAGRGLCHSLSQVLGSRWGRRTEALKGVLLPQVLSCNVWTAQRRCARLARAAGLGGAGTGTAVNNLKEGLLGLRRELGLPDSLVRLGLFPGEIWTDVGSLVSGVLRDPEVKNNPVPVDDFLIRRILEGTMGRR